MAWINDHYLKLRAGYLFPEIGRRVRAFREAHPESASRLIRCGIGDVTEPLPLAAVEALRRAAAEMGARDTFRGYGPEQGYEFLRHAIASVHYRERGIEVDEGEIFVSDGSKCDTGNILDIFAAENRVAIPDPVYPVYVDTNVMAGRTGPADERGAYEGIVYLPCREANGFAPLPPAEPVDLVYLCSPNNPTGAVTNRELLGQWVQYARAHNAILLFDAAYQAYVTDPTLPRSIYEIPGARDCAIEFRSFSKEGGFTGLRCAFTVVPTDLKAQARSGGAHRLHDLWLRRMTTKFNGVSYPVQRAAEALHTPEGKAQTRALVEHYLGNAAVLRDGLGKIGLRVFGGVNAPYLWVVNPRGLDSWATFDLLLREANVVVTPGSGFGAQGEGYFRLSAFNGRAAVEEAVARLQSLF